MCDFFSADQPPKRVLIIKLRNHGDVLLTSPVFTVLKKNWPNVETDILVYDDTEAMITRHPYIDQVHTIGRNWRKHSWFIQLLRYGSILKTLKARQYDVLINLTEHWHGSRLARYLKPRISVGFKPDKRSGIARRHWIKSFTTLYPAIQNNSRHMVEINLDALRRIGIHPMRAEDKKMIFIPGSEAETSILKKLSDLEVRCKSYILVHPTSRWMFKALNIDKLAATLDELSYRGLPIVLSASHSKKEVIYMEMLRSSLTYPVHDLSGQLTIKELGALIKYARMYIGSDSMPMHLACAVGTPVVSIFGPSGAIKWAPWGVNYRVIEAGFTCQPCGKAGCGDGGTADCINAVTKNQILNAIDAMLLETPV